MQNQCDIKFLLQLLVVTFLLICQNNSWAQPVFDIANISIQNSPDNSLIKSDNNTLKTQLINAAFGAAIKSKENVLILNPFYDGFKLTFDNTKQNIYSIGLPITFLKQWKNKNWKTAFVAIPRINSDFKNPRGNDYQFGGAVLVHYKKKETLTYQFGLYYNCEFFGPFVLPLLGIAWRASDRLNIFGVLPNKMTVEYKICRVFYGGLKANFMTNSYRYDDENFLRISDNHLKLFTDIYFTKNIVLSLEAGQSIVRKYKYGIRENGKTTYTDLHVNDGLIFKAGLIYRTRLDVPDKQ